MLSSFERRGYQDFQSSRPFLSSTSQLELGVQDVQGFVLRSNGRVGVVSFLRRKVRVLAGLLVLGAVACIVTRSSAPKLLRLAMVSTSETIAEVDATNSSSVLINTNGTATFRENLLPSTKYITAFSYAGFTNQVMEAANLIYLGLSTNRVPIIPAFIPDHFGSLADTAPTTFGDIFDVPYLSSKLGVPIVEWHELKRQAYAPPGGSPPGTEELGCWSVSAGNQASGGRPTEPSSIGLYGLDISWTPVPSHFTVTHGADQHTNVWSIWALASLSFPRSRARVLPGELHKTLPLHDGSGKKLEPDEHLLCYDLLYFTGVTDPWASGDFFADYSPFWNQVGVHMRWKESLVDLAKQYLRRHFGVQDVTYPIPPFIVVHVRHNDFVNICGQGMSKDDCFAPITAYERRVNEVKERLRSRENGLDVRNVIMTSDEDDPKWWDQVSALGPEWRWIDHVAEQTTEKYGNWFRLLLETVIQSMGKGFVGTSGSTMSEIARKRVEDWHDGESAMVQWGSPGADDH